MVSPASSKNKERSTKNIRSKSERDNAALKTFVPPPFLRGVGRSPIRRISDRAKPGDISFGLGEPDLPTPDVIREAAIRVIKRNRTDTRCKPGCPRCAKALRL